MNALVRAKDEWELVNAKRLENLFYLLKAFSGFLAFLCWIGFRRAVWPLNVVLKAQRGPPQLLKERYLEIQQVQKFF